MLKRIVDVIEGNMLFRSRNPKGEPQLGRRGLYGTIGGQRATPADQMAILWVLNLADGTHSLLDMAERSGLSFTTIHKAANVLIDAELLDTASDEPE
jgi:aminopeptidase-like protein